MLISATDIIKKTLSLYQKNFKTFLPYLLMLFTVTGILTIIQTITGPLSVVTLFYGYDLFTLVYFVLIIASIIFTIWFSIAMVKMIIKIYHGEAVLEPKIELQNSKHLIIPAFLISILVGAIVIFGTILLIIPGIFLGVLLSFSYYAVILDEHKIGQSLKTSSNLVKNRWWATFWRLFVPALFFTIILLIIQGIINIPTEIIFNNLQSDSYLHIFLLTIFSIIYVLIGVFFTPLTTIPGIILYEELKKTPFIKAKKKSKEEVPQELPKL